MIISGIGVQSGASSIVGSDTLPSSPTFRQCYVTPTGMYISLSDGNWTLLGTGTGVSEVTGSGVTNRLTKWINGSGSVIGDSGVADDGTNVLSLRPFAVGYGLSTPAQLLAGPRISAASTVSTSPRGILSAQYTTDTAGARVGFQKARGTVGTPTTVVTGDTLGRLMFRGYDGTSYLEMGSIEIASTGTIATNRVPTTMVFSTATDAGPSVLTTALTLGADQSATFAAGVSAANLTSAGLTSTRITFAGASGLLSDNANLTYASNVLGNRGANVATPGDARGSALFLSTTTSQAADIGAMIALGGENGGATTPYVFGTIAGRKTNNTGGNFLGYLAFATAAADSTLTEQMRISGAGVITMANLAGTGSRAVLADANGVLSAPVSDERLKTNIVDLNNSLDRVMALRGVSFDFIPTEGVALTSDKRPQIGMIAQEVESVIPEAVGFNAPVNGVAYRYINYDAIIPILVEAVKALQEHIK